MYTIINEGSTITGVDSDSYQRLQKEKEYLEYINTHILNVQKSFLKFFVPLLQKDIISDIIRNDEFHNAIKLAASRVTAHDQSKFGDDEFDGYRAKWYPTEKEKHYTDDNYQEKMLERYEQCWEHHYRVNDHHPIHWVNQKTGEITDMPMDAIIEMICDWEGVSRTDHDNMINWYETKATDEKKSMSPRTKAIVDEIIYNIINK